ncbi:2OG-Fe dioxygenase family protein [Luteimonas sp. 8-5]|uniref:2OG-Fe dioxygenase family protein n=1 Tax=Luteimonas sp. 8-5 TaxID=3039387 RepID=UPI00243668F6|nr:2OG-Fe dioxygenase family protein [Luteimonas sp. 8-5]MDG6348567.1 2OG-Fe dioxygenase family protein [Luteimonas sp. 8-5]
MARTLPPPYTPPAALLSQLKGRGYAVLPPSAVAALCGVELPALHALRPAWDDLVEDHYLKDGGRYRRRRHSCFVVDPDGLALAPHRAHWQSLEYNALHGGMHRWFEPIEPGTLAQPAWPRLIESLARLFSQVREVDRWFVEAHQFRIDTGEGIGRPTPEGAHRDGVDFVAVLWVDRCGILGGETRVFAADGPDGQRFTLDESWSMLLLDDARVIHESTPIQPVQAVAPDGPGMPGHRDTLVLTYRAGGFQGEDATIAG